MLIDVVTPQSKKERRISLIGSSKRSNRDSIRASIRVLSGAKLENNDVTKLGMTKRALPGNFGINIMDTGSLRLDTGNIKTAHLSVVMNMLQDPVQCGYLLNFSNKEHNAENLCFIIMVSRFRDAMRQDMAAWPRSWEELDKEFEGKDEKELTANAVWPSKRLHKPIIQKLVQSIWDNFICDEAVTQICMPAKVYSNVKRRIILFDYYGPDIFTEALLDPVKTLHKDVLPRFLASNDNVDMKARIATMKLKVLASDVIVPPPNDSPIIKSVQSITAKRMFTLHEITGNEILYNCFLKYLMNNMTSENLLCYRMISLFEDMMSENDIKDETEVTNHAWKIYRYFVAPEAPLEVSLHSRHKKELIISLANVHPQMFSELKKSATSVLAVNFNSYKSTSDYRELWKIVKMEKDKSKTFFQNVFGLYM